MIPATVDIPEKNYPFFVNLVKNLSFVKGVRWPVLLNDFLNEL